jgi:hypothetical protein
MGGGERTEIGRNRKVGWLAAKRQNASIPRGIKAPKGSGGRASGKSDGLQGAATGPSVETVDTGRNPELVAELKAERTEPADRREAK